MFDFHEKRKIRGILYSKTVIILIFSLSILLSFSVYNRYVVARDMRVKLEDKRTQLEEMRLRAEALEAKVQYLENERGIEEELRNRFDVVKEGEQVIILLDPKSKKNDEHTINVEKKEHTDTNTEKSFFDYMKFWQQ